MYIYMYIYVYTSIKLYLFMLAEPAHRKAAALRAASPFWCVLVATLFHSCPEA